MTSELATILLAEGIAVEPARRLADFGTDLLAATALVNLTAARTIPAIADHLLDAMTLVPLVRGSIVDIGSGGGLPGIPLAIATGQRTILMEAVAKKAAFLSREAERLGIDAVAVVGRAEVLAHEECHREQFLTATARAVGSLTEVLELTVPFLAVGGVALLQRGATRPEERDALADAAPMLGARFDREIELAGERRIFVVEKTQPTSRRFPRRVGIPTRRPLCSARGGRVGEPLPRKPSP